MRLFIILQLLAIKQGNCCNRKLTRSQRQSAGRATFGGDGLSTNHRKSRGVQVREENYLLPIIETPSSIAPLMREACLRTLETPRSKQTRSLEASAI